MAKPKEKETKIRIKVEVKDDFKDTVATVANGVIELQNAEIHPGHDF